MNTGNVIGGHKANLNNPNTSEESKQHSREVLENEYNGGSNDESNNSNSDEGKNPNNVYVSSPFSSSKSSIMPGPHPAGIEMEDEDENGGGGDAELYG